METRQQLEQRHALELEMAARQEAILDSLPSDITFTEVIPVVRTRDLSLLSKLDDPPVPLFHIGRTQFVTIDDVQSGRVHVRADSLNLSIYQGSVVLFLPQRSLMWRSRTRTYVVDDVSFTVPDVPCRVHTNGTAMAYHFKLSPKELWSHLK